MRAKIRAVIKEYPELGALIVFWFSLGTAGHFLNPHISGLFQDITYLGFVVVLIGGTI